MSRHFNLGNVWGRVADCKAKKSDNGTPYLAIQVECGNELHGNIKTYGRLWVQEKIDAFLDYYKQHPGSAYRFRGFFSQYDKEEGQRYSNYTFFAWEPFSGSEFRAAFILTGEVIAAEKTEDGDVRISLHLVREGSGDYKDVEEDFEVYAPEEKIGTLPKVLPEVSQDFPDDSARLPDGQGPSPAPASLIGLTVQVKGLLCYKDQEDYFGGTPDNSVVRPYVKEKIKLIVDVS